MSSSLSKIKSIVFQSCFYFTLLCFVFTAITFSGGEASFSIMSIDNLLVIFAFSFIFSLSNLIFNCRKINYFIALVLHFSAFILNIYLTLFVIGGRLDGSVRVLSVISVFAMVYLIMAIPFTIARALRKRNETSAKSYKRMY